MNSQNLPELSISSQQDVNTETSNLIINPQALAQMSQFAQMMAQSKSMVPQHMQGNIGDCLAICMQAMQWGMNPFAVAQKTFNIRGVLGYEAQLVNAVITSRAPTTGRLQYEWFGPWENIIGRFKEVSGKNGQENKIVKDWTLAEEKGLGVKIWATIKGEENPRVLELLLSQAGVRNSPLWGQDPKQQLAYLAVKRWARLHCPDVILGVYTPDELADRNNESPRNVTPKATNAGAAALLNRVKQQPTAEAPVIEYYDTSELLSTIEQITDVKQIAPIGAEIKRMMDDAAINLRNEDINELRQALADQKQSIILADEYSNIMKHVKACKSSEDVERMRGLIADKKQDFDEGDIKMLNDTLDVVAEEIGAQG